MMPMDSKYWNQFDSTTVKPPAKSLVAEKFIETLKAAGIQIREKTDDTGIRPSTTGS